jgi:hypothetical protein
LDEKQWIKKAKVFGYLRQKLPNISEVKMKKKFSLIHKLNDYLKTETLYKIKFDRKKVLGGIWKRLQRLPRQ